VNQFVRQKTYNIEVQLLHKLHTNKNDKDVKTAHLALLIAKLDTSLGFGR